jgi:putative membrane protein insertion efficiency factor
MKRIVLLLIQFYRTCISPYTPRTCRYTPTCSQYALEAVTKYGALKGGFLALKRILRCHPFSKHDLYDPVP